MAEESKNEYAAQLQRFNRDQAHFYFSQMPQIFDVSALSLLTKSLNIR
jgi:thyroid hormone receptor interactor 10